MNETVTSVSKREQKLSEAAAAVTVLSNEDIRRSGATTIPDVLRLVPGMSVGSVNANQWSVSSRGFNNLYANKLLVLIDGRAVYSPMFAGVYWDLEQTMLEDVDRIEIIRGPGATVWGANAMNGVINIVTRGARDTQGGLVQSSLGDVQRTQSSVRYGGRLGERTYYRVHAGVFATGDFTLSNGQSADDSWRGTHGGFRIDHHPNDDSQLTWLAGATGIETDNNNTDARNLHTIARYTRRISDRSGMEVQAYYDHTLRDESQSARVRTDTIDLSAQHTFGLGERHDIIWGAGFRYIDAYAGQTNPALQVIDDKVRTRLFSLFVQDEIKLVPDKFTLTGGVKIEHNDYTGVEIQPSMRGVLKVGEKQTWWGAVSRAVRTPSAIEGRNVFSTLIGPAFPGPGGDFEPRVVGNPDISAEVLWAYELGYRVSPTRRVNLDVAVFFHDYEELISIGDISQFIPGVPVGTAEIPFDNSLEGHTYGGEITLTISPTDTWRLTATYALLIADIRGPASANPDLLERGSPRNQATLRSAHDLTRRLRFDAQLRYVDAIQGVPAYLTADFRVAFRMTDQLEFSLVGQNLFDPSHPEQGPAFFAATSEVPRGFYGKLLWRF